MSEKNIHCELIRRSTDVLVVGSEGTMGALFLEAFSHAVTVDGIHRNSSNYGERIENAKVIILATKQQAALDWLVEFGSTLGGDQVVLSLAGFLDFDCLHAAGTSTLAKIGLVMTDTSMQKIDWCDGGAFSNYQRLQFQALLEKTGATVRLVENYERIEQRTMEACLTGWLADEMAHNVTFLMSRGYSSAEAHQVVDVQLATLVKKRAQGLMYTTIADEVATKGGATRVGIEVVSDSLSGMVASRYEAAIERVRVIKEACWTYLNEKLQKKGLAAGAN